MKFVLKWTLLLILFFNCSLKAQNGTANNFEQRQFDLKYKVEKNYELLKDNPKEAFRFTAELIKEAKELGAFNEELELLNQRVLYYYHHDLSFDQLISSARGLKEKAQTYNSPYLQTQANLYLFDAYCLNNLYDDALSELEEAQETLSKVRNESDKFHQSKSKIYIAYANYYSTIGNTKKEIESLLSSVKEQDKISDKKNLKDSQTRDYANLANAYSRMEKYDSAKLFAEISMRLIKESKKKNENLKFINYSAIGDFFYFSEKDFPEALKYYKEAEQLSQQMHYLNVARLYRKMADAYDCMGNDILKQEYEYKLKDVSLKVAESQNESLHKIIDETKKQNNSRVYIAMITGSLLVIIGLLFVTIRYRHRTKTLEQQEKVSYEYLQQQTEFSEQSYKDLIEMVKNSNSAFLGEFLKVFPDFFEKLHAVNPNIVQTEVEFCALLKLNLPTKDIARFKNLEPKTVQNKKYRIRKRLNIPENIDIYYWFSQL